MFNFKSALLQDLAVHKVGNNTDTVGLSVSKGLLQIDEDLKSLLKKYFLSPFKDHYLYTFYHSNDLFLNEVYTYANAVFDNPGMLYPQSVNLAKQLYESSKHPNIKEGEFYVVYFEECVVGGEVVDALGLFKSENKETYLKVYEGEQQFSMEKDKGINIKKLDKGCLIFNTEKEAGYKVSIIDSTNKNGEAQYWKDDFLSLKPREDIYYHTHNYIEMCKDFADEAFEEASKVDKIGMVDSAVSYFSNHDQFNIKEFEEEVMQEPELIEAFEDYKGQYEGRKEVKTFEEFDISKPAVKKSKRYIRSVIKLDKSFHVYVHSNRENIVRGYDEERKKHFYTLYFEEES